ncbi:MAG: DUF4446 family protein [Actinomycetota bacterium]|nr:DUF4446 family protein [Actinomycetota bacterium]MDP2287487.1 DUF4446 family protein [Actinomycetota bacterium]
MIIDTSALSVLVIVSLLIGMSGVAVGVFAMVRLSHLHRSYALLEAAEGRENFVDVVARTIEEFHVLRDEVGDLDLSLAQTRRELAQALRHVSVVRYDAFGDLGGRFSFSAAMLDDSGDGLVLTSIHGRSETRTYLKGLSGGIADIELSPEENEALKLAKRSGS